jgi:hypothetical protein
MSEQKPADDQKKRMVEIDEDKLEELLKSSELEIGKNVRVIKALEIGPGSIIAKQYDR